MSINQTCASPLLCVRMFTDYIRFLPEGIKGENLANPPPKQEEGCGC